MQFCWKENSKYGLKFSYAFCKSHKVSILDSVVGTGTACLRGQFLPDGEVVQALVKAGLFFHWIYSIS